MPVDTSKIRTVAVVGHAFSGKTSLIDAVLFISKAVNTHGRVANGTSAADCLPDELERKMTIHAKSFHCQWQGHSITLLDTPGLRRPFRRHDCRHSRSRRRDCRRRRRGRHRNRNAPHLENAR